MSKSKIEWTDAVWNPITGCTKVSDGCKHCYAEIVAKRFWGERKFTDIICHDDRLEQPLHWKKPRMIFVNSMSDLFHEKVPFDFIDSVFDVMMFCNIHIFQILTKRPERALEYYNSADKTSGGMIRKDWLQDNSDDFKHIWLGVSVENQEQADKRIPLLLQIPAAVRWISAEPLLGPIDLTNITFDKDALGNGYRKTYSLDVTYPSLSSEQKHIKWVIVGGESGPSARPMHPDWVRSLRDQCKAAGVPFFFKQWGEWTPLSEYGNSPLGMPYDICQSIKNSFTFYNGITVYKIGKSKSGHLLDGKEYREFPQT